jgi:hypothetical protein
MEAPLTKSHLRKGTKKFKIVDRYEMNWPIREALKGRLKNTSNRAKQRVQRQTDQKIKKVRRTVDFSGRVCL